MAGSPLLARCYIGLGSNLENPIRQIETALTELNSLPMTRCEKVSSFYHSQPMGPADQPNFVNAVAELLTELPAPDLLTEMLNIELRHGRLRANDGLIKNGPRTLDLDLLLHGNQVVNEPGLTLPHPGLHQRDFVILPLLEIAPDLIIPDLGPLLNFRTSAVEHGAKRGQPPNWQA